LVLVEGAAGIGKTRLLSAAAERARGSELGLLLARCSELEREFANGVVRQLFERSLAEASPGLRARLLAGSARHAAAAIAVGSVEPVSGGLDASVDAGAVVHGLYGLCANFAEEHPLLLVVDDAHWADAPSLRFLEYLARRLHELPIGLLVAARPNEPDSDQQLLARLASSAMVLRPRPLSREAVERLVTVGLGAPEAGFVDACSELTSGNPFLVGELVRSCAEEGVEARNAAVSRIRTLVPRTVARSVLVRMARLPESAVRVARAVAVLGGGAELRYAAPLAGVEEFTAAQAADLLCAIEVLVPGRPLRFAHPLLQAAVYTDIPAAERARAHEQAAELLRGDDAPPERLAIHLLAVERRADPELVQTLRTAARSAADRGGPDVAATYLRRALAEPPPLDWRAEVLLEAGTVEALAGDPAAPAHLAEALELTRDQPANVLAAVTLGRALLASDRPSDAVVAFERVLARIADDSDDVRLLLEGGALGAGMLDAVTAPTLAKRLRRLERDVNARPAVPFNALAVAAMHTAIANRDRKGAIELARRALSREGPLADAAGRAPFFYHACSALLFAEDYETVRPHLDAWLEDARERGAPQQFARCSCFLSWLAFLTGDVGASEAHARSALDAEAFHSQPLFRPMSLGRLIAALVERGELDSADGELERHAPQERSSFHYALFLHDRGTLRLAQTRAGEALEDLLECGRRLHKIGAISPSVTGWRSNAARAHLLLDQREQAIHLASEELALARAWGGPRALSAALRAAGLVEGGAPGIELLEQAAAITDRSPARLEHAHARAELGAALRRARHRVKAREQLRVAADLGLRCGATRLADTVRTDLLATGARPRRVMLSGVDALTPSEHRIATMASEGMSNREIAQALFLSPWTVKAHLAHIYQKLSIDSREHLATALER
jgi:DNA-binding CsgD family transcriptional regulator